MRIGIFTEVYTPYISGVVTSEVMLKKALEKMGHEVYKKYNLTVEEMEDGLFNAYEEIGKELGIKVSCVGRCFKYCTDFELFDCYSTDKSHPSKIGSFIVALCHFKTIFNSLDKVKYYYEFDEKTLNELKEIINKCCVER